MNKAYSIDIQRNNTVLLLKITVILFGLYIILFTQKTAMADNLLTLFNAEAFHGSLETINKFNWVGKLMQWIISVFSMLGLFLICYQRLITLLYLSGRNTFDTVHDLKGGIQAGPGRDAFGFKSMVTNAMSGGQYGTGLDALVGFGLSLLPDVKKYSDYNPERMAFNLDESDSCTTYMLKVALPTIMLIFFFAMGFNGTLWQGYGVIVDGMATAAENLVDVNLSSIVNTAMNRGKSYTFPWGAAGTDYGDFMQGMAKSIYKEALKNGKDYTNEGQQKVGKYIDQILSTGKSAHGSVSLTKGSTGQTTAISSGSKSIFSDADTLAKAIGEVTGFKGGDDAKNLEYTVMSSKTKDPFGQANTAEFVISAYDLDLNSEASGNYIHVFVKKKSNADETQYWSTPADGKDASVNSGTTTNNTDTNAGGTQ